MFGRLLRERRGRHMTQGALVALVRPGGSNAEATRKGDSPTLENGHLPNPQQATVDRVCTAPQTPAEVVEPRRLSKMSRAEQTGNIPTLSRDRLDLLAHRCGDSAVHDPTDAALRDFLTEKAKDYRRLRDEVAALTGVSDRIDNMPGAADDALEAQEFDRAEAFLQDAREIVADQLRQPLEVNATLMKRQASIALRRGRVDEAYAIYVAAADNFGSIGRMEVARRRDADSGHLYDHLLRYGGTGFARAIDPVDPVATDHLRAQGAALGGGIQNNLAITLARQGKRASRG